MGIESSLHHPRHLGRQGRSACASRRRFLQGALAFGATAMPGWPRNNAPSEHGQPDALGLPGYPGNVSGIRKSLADLANRTALFDTHEHLWRESARLGRKLDVFLLFGQLTCFTAGTPTAVNWRPSLRTCPTFTRISAGCTSFLRAWHAARYTNGSRLCHRTKFSGLAATSCMWRAPSGMRKSPGQSPHRSWRSRSRTGTSPRTKPRTCSNGFFFSTGNNSLRKAVGFTRHTEGRT